MVRVIDCDVVCPGVNDQKVMDHEKPCVGDLYVMDHEKPSVGNFYVMDHEKPSVGDLNVTDHEKLSVGDLYALAQAASHQASSSPLICPLFSVVPLTVLGDSPFWCC